VEGNEVRTTVRLLMFAGDANPGFHLIEVFAQSAAAGRSEAIFGARNASLKKLHAGNVLRFFQLAGVDAEISVGGLEHALEVVKAERVVSGKCTDDAEANALMNKTIELGEFWSSWRRVFTNLLARTRGGCDPRFLLLAMRGQSFSHRASSR
jgi:hypothetical protein